ncbi:MAG: TGS domain-containing protein, partial [Ruminococcus sp.]|nr:TGS domain-containing protein [Ruminococcus sp.]
MIRLTLKDGSVREIEAASPASEIVKGIGMGLYKAACCVKINGEVKDLRTVIDSDCEFEVCTFDSIDGKKTFWHTASHILAQAVKRLYPEAKLAIGPAIDNGFYYDFDLEKPFSPDELEKIEAEMKKIVKEGIALEQFELSPEEAIAKLEEMDEPYKVELCREHADKGEPISFYKQAEFIDLCAGPHLMTTAPVKAFKLLSCTGAYWRGSEKNKMLSRVYATAYPKAADLEADIKQREEAKLRDHNKLGRELEYFTTVDCIGQGLPILLPK